MDTDSFSRAMAAVLNPRPFSCSTQSSSRYVQGTWNTVPMLTRQLRRYSGLEQAGVSSTASIFSAAALRKMAPTLVGFIISSSTATRFAPRQTSSTAGSAGRRMAHSIPRVRW